MNRLDFLQKIDLRLPFYSVLTATLGAVFCVLTLTGAMVRVKSHRGTIKVTGSAREQVRADFTLWHGQITQEAPTLPQAYHDLRESEHKATAYLIAQGLSASEISPAAIATETVYVQPKPVLIKSGADGPHYLTPPDPDPNHRKIAAYKLTEGIDVQSDKVSVVDQVSRTATDLISQGVAFTTGTPQYVYRDMAGLKLRIMAAAGKNALEKAQGIAESGGGGVGDLQFVHMGVMQVTPAYEDTPVTSAGVEDTTSLDKKVTAVVTAGYTLR